MASYVDSTDIVVALLRSGSSVNSVNNVSSRNAVREGEGQSTYTVQIFYKWHPRRLDLLSISFFSFLCQCNLTISIPVTDKQNLLSFHVKIQVVAYTLFSQHMEIT